MCECRDSLYIFVGIVKVVVVTAVSKSLIPEKPFRFSLNCQNGRVLLDMFVERHLVHVHRHGFQIYT